MLLLTSMLTSAFNIQPAKAAGVTIYIRADGSVDPSSAPILNVENVNYTFTGDIYESIIVERDNIVVDGADYTVYGTGSRIGIDLSYRNNVTVKNVRISTESLSSPGEGIRLYDSSNNTIVGNNITANRLQKSNYGIDLYYSSYNTIVENYITNNSVGIELIFLSNHNVISRNNITKNKYGIFLQSESSDNTLSANHMPANWNNGISVYYSSNNTVSRNNITGNTQWGIELYYSSSNTLCGNNLKDNDGGIYLANSPNNTVSGNNIVSNNWGIPIQSWGQASSSDNLIYHNNFIENALQAQEWNPPSINVWDDGYPSGGNYWSDYEENYPDATEIDDSGIWDTPYVIDENNQDNYPLVNPWTPAPPEEPDDFADMGNVTDEASHNLIGWGAAQGPPENPHISPSGDRTKRYQLLRGDNSVDLMVGEAGVPYFLTAEVEDGYCTDNFEIYVNGEGPIYEYTGKNVGTGPVTVVSHQVLVPAEYITARRVTITFRNTATDDCGLAAVYNVGLTPTPPPKFRIGDWARTTANLNVREGPGLGYTIIDTMSEGILGQIVGGPVEADGFVWWDVDYAVGVRGWSVQNWLQLTEERVPTVDDPEVNYNPDGTPNFYDDPIQIILARAIFGEARNGNEEEGIAVGWVIRNRVENPRWGEYYHDAILQPGQFSSFNPNDPNYPLILNPLSGSPVDDEAWYECYEIAGRILNDEVPDPTDEATHFFSPISQEPPHGPYPVPGTSKVAYYAYWAEPKDGWEILKDDLTYYVTIKNELEWKPLEGIRNWYFMFYRPYILRVRAEMRSPAEFRVYDSQRRVTGLVNGTVVTEIPESVYFENTVTIFFPNDTYQYVVAGTTEGLYGLTVTAVTRQENITFTAIDIPTSPNATHQYSVDLDALSQDEEGVTIQIDYDGDGIFEHTFISDGELNESEYVHAELTYLEAFTTNLPEEVFITDDPDEFDEFKKELIDKIDETLEELDEDKYTESTAKLNDMKEEVIVEDKLQTTTKSGLSVIIDHIISSIETLQQA